MNLTEFRATRREVDNLRDFIPDLSISNHGYLYDDGAFIENNDGKLHLQLYNESYAGTVDSLPQFEAALYTWCLSECGSEWNIPANVVTFLRAIMDCMTYGEFGDALLRNYADPHSGVCYLQDFCDVNQVALDCCGDDMDAATALYYAASPWLRGIAA